MGDDQLTDLRLQNEKLEELRRQITTAETQYAYSTRHINLAKSRNKLLSWLYWILAAIFLGALFVSPMVVTASTPVTKMAVYGRRVLILVAVVSYPYAVEPFARWAARLFRDSVE